MYVFHDVHVVTVLILLARYDLLYLSKQIIAYAFGMVFRKLCVCVGWKRNEVHPRPIPRNEKYGLTAASCERYDVQHSHSLRAFVFRSTWAGGEMRWCARPPLCPSPSAPFEVPKTTIRPGVLAISTCNAQLLTGLVPIPPLQLNTKLVSIYTYLYGISPAPLLLFRFHNPIYQ